MVKRKPLSEETKRKISASLMGHSVSIEVRMAVGNAQRGRVASEETKVKLRLAHKGRVVSEETRRRLSKALKGKPISQEARKKMRAAKIGCKLSQSHKDHIGAAQKGRVFSAIHKERLSRTRALSIIEGRFHPGGQGFRKGPHRGISGWFWSEKNKKKIRWRSKTLELRWYEKLERDNSVRSYHAEPYSIPYLWKGSIHHYLPDLRIVFIDGHEEVWELKPEDRRTSPLVRAKCEAAEVWCNSKSPPLIFKIVGYKELR